MLCDYCGKDISEVGYVHFDGGTGPAGMKCPTYDNFRLRRTKEVEKAEAEALEKIRRDNPNINADDLKIKFTDKSPSKRVRELHEANPFPGGGLQLPNRFPGPHNHNHDYRVDNDIAAIPPAQYYPRPHHHHHHHHHHPHHDLGPALYHQPAQREQEVQAYQNQLNQRIGPNHLQQHGEHQIQARRIQQQQQVMAREANRRRERVRQYNPEPNPDLNMWPDDDSAAFLAEPFDREGLKQMGLPIPDLGRPARNPGEAESRQQH